MENLILAAESRGGVRVYTYEKAAGDMLVHYWCKKHLPELRYRFDNNETQAAVTRWLQLPRLTLQPDVTMRVECWNEHNLGDFFETLTLYLPSKVLNLLMNVSAIYYWFFNSDSMPAPTCRARDADGLLTCQRKAKNGYGGYCCHTHWRKAQQHVNTGSKSGTDRDSTPSLDSLRRVPAR